MRGAIKRRHQSSSECSSVVSSVLISGLRTSASSREMVVAISQRSASRLRR
jgi:hypothetical protein